MLIKIQQSAHPDLTLPYPFVIAEDGKVEHQEFWKGDPGCLIGFQDTLANQTLGMTTDRWWADPQLAVGKYPIFVNNNGAIYVARVAIAEVTVYEDLNPAVTVGNRQDWTVDLLRGRTVIGHVWWDNAVDKLTYNVQINRPFTTTEPDTDSSGSDSDPDTPYIGPVTEHDTVNGVAGVVGDAGYALSHEARAQLIELADVINLPRVAVVHAAAREAREAARETGLAHARHCHALALTILRSRWPEAAAVEADLSPHYAQEGNPRITRVLDATNATVHRVEDTEDNLLRYAEEALAVALDFADETAVGWAEPTTRHRHEDGHEDGGEDGGDGPVHTLTLHAAAPEPEPTATPAELPRPDVGSPPVTRIDRGVITLDGTACRVIELVDRRVDHGASTFEVLAADTPDAPPDPDRLALYLASLRTLPELERETGLSSEELDALIFELTPHHRGHPVFTGHSRGARRTGKTIVHPYWIDLIRTAAANQKGR